MKVLVTGANGQLGNELRIRSAKSSGQYVFTDVSQVDGVETVFLDITDAEAVRHMVESERADLIINCAAYTNVDKAEDDEQTADLLNRQAVANLAGAAAGAGATMIHISTDYVFAGDACAPIPESEEPAPASAYGRTKLAGERAVADSGCKYIIIRTAWLYSPFGKNFVKTMKSLTSDRTSLKVVYDQVGSPTYAADLADAIVSIVERGMTDRCGIYHFTDEGAISWYDFACEICSLSGNECDIEPCLSSEFPSKAARPHYSVLDKSLFRTTFEYKIPHWKVSLRDCINRLSK